MVICIPGLNRRPGGTAPSYRPCGSHCSLLQSKSPVAPGSSDAQSGCAVESSEGCVAHQGLKIFF